MSKNGNGKNSDRIRFWFKGAPFLVNRQAASVNGHHVRVETLVKGKLRFVALRLEENGDCAWNAFRIELPHSKRRQLPKAKSLSTISYQSTEKRPK